MKTTAPAQSRSLRGIDKINDLSLSSRASYRRDEAHPRPNAEREPVRGASCAPEPPSSHRPPRSRSSAIGRGTGRAGGPGPAGPGTTEQPPGEPAQTGDAVADTTDIVVTGVRASLSSARADQARFAADHRFGRRRGHRQAARRRRRRHRRAHRRRAGLAQAAARPRSVLVRGLPYFTTTYNGREIFTAETRVGRAAGLPVGNVAALEVYQDDDRRPRRGRARRRASTSVAASRSTSRIARSPARPGRNTRSARARSSRNGNAARSPIAGTPASARSGVLVNVSYTELHYLDSTRSNTDFVANPTVNGQASTVLFPDIQRCTTFGEGDRQRPSVNAALQWKPTTGLEIYGEALWQGFRNKVSDHEYSSPALRRAILYEHRPRPGNNVVQSLTAVNPQRPEGFQGATFGTTDTYQYAIGGTYDAGPLKVSADIARTASTLPRFGLQLRHQLRRAGYGRRGDDDAAVHHPKAPRPQGGVDLHLPRLLRPAADRARRGPAGAARLHLRHQFRLPAQDRVRRALCRPRLAFRGRQPLQLSGAEPHPPRLGPGQPRADQGGLPERGPRNAAQLSVADL